MNPTLWKVRDFSGSLELAYGRLIESGSPSFPINEFTMIGKDFQLPAACLPGEPVTIGNGGISQQRFNTVILMTTTEYKRYLFTRLCFIERIKHVCPCCGQPIK